MISSLIVEILKILVYIKQAIQGLFTAGTSEQKEKVGGKRGLTPWFVSHETSVCPNNPAGTN